MADRNVFSNIAGALNARVFQIATQAPTLAASVNTSAFNVGNALGPAVGAWVIAVGFGLPATVVAAIVLALAALVMVAVAIRVERTWARQSEPTVAEAAC